MAPSNLGPVPLPAPSGPPLAARAAPEVEPLVAKEAAVDEEIPAEPEGKVTSMTEALEALRDTRKRAKANAKKTRMAYRTADSGALKTRRFHKS